MLEAFATAQAFAFGHLHHKHHLLRADGQGVDAPQSFAAPPILLALALRADDGLVFDGQMELHPAINILRAAILVALAHTKSVIQQTLAHPDLVPSPQPFRTNFPDEPDFDDELGFLVEKIDLHLPAIIKRDRQQRIQPELARESG